MKQNEEELKKEEISREEKQEAHNRDMAATEKAQLRYQKLSFAMNVLRTLFMAGIFAVVLWLAYYIVPKVNTVYDSTMHSLNNLEHLTTELQEANLGGTVQNINSLTIKATDDLSSAMNKMNSIDMETLNNAITNLNDTVKPMAEFFGAFGGGRR
ncbi:MAG: hypothetical protein K6E50_11070 [Lachnospiraceae bacterium]|nr:hypothetical protein [Lachnospiraceae bacterium]